MNDRYYEVKRTVIATGERIEVVPKRVHIDNRPQLRRETEEFMAAIDRMRAMVEALPSMRRLRERQHVERMASRVSAALDAWRHEEERDALRARLDAMAAGR